MDNLRIRKITKEEKYKIYDITTGEIIKIYDSRQLAHNALKRMKHNSKAVVGGGLSPFLYKKKEVKFNENADVVIIHIKDGDVIKEKIKEKLKK